MTLDSDRTASQAATRLAGLSVAVTMLVAALVVHSGDPFPRKELALVYAIPFITLIFTGAGDIGIDRMIRYRKKKSIFS